MSRRAVPLADARALTAAARRTAALRLLLAGAVLLAVAAAYLLARGTPGAARAAAGRSGTVVVLDVSGSVENDAQSHLVRSVLGREIRAAGPHGRVGLVLFSDTAIETLPPTAPAAALASFRRFFVPLRRPATGSATPSTGSSVATRYPTSPWEMFVGGTSISTGLHEARLALARAGLDGGRVLLVSDLVDSGRDLPRLRREVAAYARDPRLDLQVRVLPAEMPQARDVFRRAFGSAAIRSAGAPFAAAASAHRGRHPSWLVVAAAAAAALLLAVHELLATPLRWRTSAEAAS